MWINWLNSEIDSNSIKKKTNVILCENLLILYEPKYLATKMGHDVSTDI